LLQTRRKIERSRKDGGINLKQIQKLMMPSRKQKKLEWPSTDLRSAERCLKMINRQTKKKNGFVRQHTERRRGKRELMQPGIFKNSNVKPPLQRKEGSRIGKKLTK